MRRLSVILIVAALTAGAWLTVPRPSEAHGISVSLGVGFVVGGASFRVAYVPGGYVPYFYRLENPLHYQGYSCTGYCYIGGAHYYHAPYCPVVRHHFTRYRYEGYRHHDHRYGGDYRGYPRHRHDKRRYYDRRRDPRYPGGHYRGQERYRHDKSRHYRGRDPRGERHYGSSSRRDGRSRDYERPRSQRRPEVKHQRDDRRRSVRRSGSARRTRPPR